MPNARHQPSDAGRPKLRIVRSGAPEPTPELASPPPLSVVRHEVTPTKWILQTYDRDGLPGVTLSLGRPKDLALADELTAWLQSFYATH